VNRCFNSEFKYLEVGLDVDNSKHEEAQRRISAANIENIVETIKIENVHSANIPIALYLSEA